MRDALAELTNFDATEIESTFKSTAATLGVKVGALVHPTRLAVTGSNVGPSLYHLLEILGKEKVLARIDRALKCSKRFVIERRDLAMITQACLWTKQSRRQGHVHFLRFLRPGVFERDRAVPHLFVGP